MYRNNKFIPIASNRKMLQYLGIVYNKIKFICESLYNCGWSTLTFYSNTMRDMMLSFFFKKGNKVYD